MKNFEKIMRSRMLELGYNVRSLSTELNISTQTMYHLFRQNNPDIEFLRKICNALGLDIRKMVDEIDHVSYIKTDNTFDIQESTLHMLQLENKMLRQNLDLANELLLKKSK